MSRSRSSSSANRTKPAASWVAIAAAALLALPACGIPKLHCADPAPPLPDTFNGVATGDSSAQLTWCEFFNDPALASLIGQALSGNQELKILTQEIRVASNEVLARRGDYLPFVRGGLGAGLDKSSRFTREGAVEDQLEVAPGKPFPEPLPDFLVAANVTWEIDIWRKLRNARDAASLRYLGTREGQNYVATRLISEVAENYYELMALDNRMQALERTIQIQEQSLELAKANKEAARDTELAVQRFQAEVRKNQSERLIIQQEIVEVENRINFLLGRYPQPVARNSAGYIDLTLPALSVGVPAQLLRTRADIREAERKLQAAGLDVRVARARFYPSLDIGAGVGYRAFNTRYLFVSPESLIYNATGDLVAPLINKKAIQADYLTANALQLEALYNYQRTILNAFVEVINRVSKVENYGRSIEIKKQQLESLEASVDSATKLFQSARAEYMDVLLAQRDLMEARMVLIETKQQQLSAIVLAYQALGGGSAYMDQLKMCGPCYPAAPGGMMPAQAPFSLLPAEPEQIPAATPEPPPSEPLPTGPEMMPLPDPGASRRNDESSLRVLPTGGAAANG